MTLWRHCTGIESRYWFLISVFRFSISDFRFPISDFWFPIWGYDFWFLISDFRKQEIARKNFSYLIPKILKMDLPQLFQRLGAW